MQEQIDLTTKQQANTSQIVAQEATSRDKLVQETNNSRTQSPRKTIWPTRPNTGDQQLQTTTQSHQHKRAQDPITQRDATRCKQVQKPTKSADQQLMYRTAAYIPIAFQVHVAPDTTAPDHYPITPHYPTIPPTLQHHAMQHHAREPTSETYNLSIQVSTQRPVDPETNQLQRLTTF